METCSPNVWHGIIVSLVFFKVSGESVKLLQFIVDHCHCRIC